jgi:hypothetical protein
MKKYIANQTTVVSNALGRHTLIAGSEYQEDIYRSFKNFFDVVESEVEPEPTPEIESESIIETQEQKLERKNKRG